MCVYTHTLYCTINPGRERKNAPAELMKRALVTRTKQAGCLTACCSTREKKRLAIYFTSFSWNAHTAEDAHLTA